MAGKSKSQGSTSKGKRTVVDAHVGSAGITVLPTNSTTRMAVPNLDDAKGAGTGGAFARRFVGPALIVGAIDDFALVGPGLTLPHERDVIETVRVRHTPAAVSASPARAAAPEPAASLDLAETPAPAPPISRIAALADVPARFNADDDDLLVCRQVHTETHDVKTFVFASRNPRLFRFHPGQFMTFDWPVGDEPVQRCYTIASAPSRPDTFAITVKRVPGGPVSNWLHDNLVPGMEVRAVGPMGEFTCATHPAEKYLFVSGGSGITPLMSMSRAITDLAEDRDVVFVHAARTPADIVFRAELDAIARAHARFKVAYVVESDAGEPGWPGFRGRLSWPMLSLIAPDLHEREVFTCGPSPFMKAVRAMLSDGGADMRRYHEESFNFEELAPITQAAAARAEEKLVEGEARGSFRVTFSKSGRAIDCPDDTFVLQAARAAGMKLPASCTKGLCGTCKSRLVSGQVEMKHAGGIRQREIDQGLVLLCCSKPLTDLVVER
ncbi:2Fe-2S iron-sulfur cluster-binding protein [Pseudoxanthobacter sp. M-2]|uniref:2Fe-2S iron-sulfur cluster-binding protein n=1 Tax=Pseudoxanthobacter sp. M-2 TaxID=3078754 RepID=UPI0038FCCAEE